MKDLVFVYGTLLTKQRNHYLLENSKYICKALLNDYFMFRLSSYPGIQKGKGIILGEVYEVDELTLNDLDILEAVGYLYKKEKVLVLGDDNNTYSALVYEYILNQFEKPIETKTYYW